MNDLFYQILHFLTHAFNSGNALTLILLFFPFVLIIELPYYAIIILAAIRRWLKLHYTQRSHSRYQPIVTVVVTAYSEKEGLYPTLETLCEQLYPGHIEILVVVDGAIQNHKTSACAENFIRNYQYSANRSIQVINKQTRGGLANSRNVGLEKANGEIIIVVDADTSLDNRCITKAVKHFANPNVVALSGALRVRNHSNNLICRLQALEYKLGIELGRYSLAEANVMNNISGAFGIFRVTFLRRIGGWLNGTAEDLDLTLRIQAYTKRYPHLRMEYEPKAIAYTGVPDTFKDYFNQRLRWEGDTFYIYVRRHWRNFSGKMMGKWRSLMIIWYGLYYQIVLPFVITFYYIYILLNFNLGILLGINVLVYLYYFIVMTILFILYLTLIAENPKRDCKFIPTLFVIPIFQLGYRFATVYFLLNEMLFKGHKDTSMAPWWIIKKTK